MECIGDKVARDEDGNEMYDTTAECYRIQGCPGCSKCWIKCAGCDNCTKEETLREPEVGDYVTVKQPILTPDYKGPAWSDAMNLAIGRVAWVAKGNRVEGYRLKFSTTKKEVLDQFIYPPSALKLALPPDNMVDKLIRTTKEANPNEDM
jgi:hypothetical protein